jgi:predicted cupin superfamily sugar epimerase
MIPENAQQWIDQLKLLPHPEGGFYRETYRSTEQISSTALPPRFNGSRNFSTSIYFLLRSQDRSLFHRIRSDELWHFHAGSSLSIYILNEKELIVQRLGNDLAVGQQLQVVVPAQSWFGASVDDPDTFTLAGCTVAPGFDFHDFELASRTTLLETFPQHHDIIYKLTKSNA